MEISNEGPHADFETTQPRRIFWVLFWARKRVPPVAASDIRDENHGNLEESRRQISNDRDWD